MVSTTHTEPIGFEQCYLAMRQKEGRIYTDEEVSQLPVIRKEHPYYKEWQLRKESCERLQHYFGRRSFLSKILDVGCGNGWLTSRLARLTGADVTGIDTNLEELQQGARVFNHIPNLQFISGNIHNAAISHTGYDAILFAASIQYFHPLHDYINETMQWLNPGGEIHILDSPIYTADEVNAAINRTTTYYNDLGFPEMIEYYFHHTMNDLSLFQPEILYKPSFINQYVLNNKNPFPWICIKKQ